VQRRRGHRLRARYRALVRIVSTVGALTAIVVLYLVLLTNVTRLNYELTKAAGERAGLVEESGRLDDQIARLESRDRLSLLAARLGMHESLTFAEIPQPVAAAPKPGGPAILSWLK